MGWSICNADKANMYLASGGYLGMRKFVTGLVGNLRTLGTGVSKAESGGTGECPSSGQDTAACATGNAGH